MSYFKSIPLLNHKWILCILLCIHTFFCLVYVQHQPLTNDESDYIEYAKRWLKGQPDKVFDVDDSKTPIVAIAWLPRIIKQITQPNLQANDWGRADQLLGRYLMIVFFWLVFLYLYFFSKSLYGNKGWWLPITLLLIDPLFMAFTPVVTSDVASVFVLLAASYHYYKFCSTKNNVQFLLTAFFTGLALVTKSSMIFLPFIFLLIYVCRLLAKQAVVPFNKSALTYGIVFIAIVWLVVNMGYYFHHSFNSWGSIEFKSTSVKQLINTFSFLKPLPTLLPEPFIRGFDLLQYHSEVGPFTPNLPYKGVFILNQKFNTGVWYYYFVTAFFKFTIGFLLLAIATLLVAIRIFNLKTFTKKYIFIVAPFVVYGCMLCFVNPFQQGIRHAMILLPFVFLAIGKLPDFIKQYFEKGKWLLIALVLYALISVATVYPEVMPYTNEFLLNKTKLFRYLAEYNYRPSDIPRDIQPFLAKNVDYRIAPNKPEKGKFIVPGAFVYNTTYEVYSNYAWLKNYQPIGHYRYVFLLFEVK